MPHRASLALASALLFACETDAAAPEATQLPRDAQILDAGSPDAQARADAATPLDARAAELALCPGVTPLEGTPCSTDDECGPSRRCSPAGAPLSSCQPLTSSCGRDADCEAGHVCAARSAACTALLCLPRCEATSCGPDERCDGRVCQPIRCEERPSLCAAPARCQADAGGNGCAFDACARSADCSCGSCVRGSCNPHPGVCVSAAALP